MLIEQMAIQKKIERIKDGASPRFLDLFSGCGGISLGFTTAGFKSIGAVEIDKHAAASHGHNFFKRDALKVHSKNRDIHDEPASLFSDLNVLDPVEEQIDVLVGGPPCQAFARVGRAKLRSEAKRKNSDAADKAYLLDERADLVKQYLRIVDELKPLALLIENVPDMMNHGTSNVAEITCQELRKHGYKAQYTLLNSVFYGVPQTRERMFLIAYREELKAEVRWPDPICFHTLPKGYSGTRATALKLVGKGNQPAFEFSDSHYYQVEQPTSGKNLVAAISVQSALSDLPKINALKDHLEGRMKKGAKPLDVRIPYSSSKLTPYAILMRNWPGYETDNRVTANVIRYLPRDFKFFREMEQGWQYPQIHAWVERERKKLIEDRTAKGLNNNASDESFQKLISEWTIPYDPKKFPNKWWKLVPDQPSRTLLAHLGKDSYSHIHYDHIQARTITVREAARLQSFPDGFEFPCSMNAALRQIGNAVPPLVSYALAREIGTALGAELPEDFRKVLADERSTDTPKRTESQNIELFSLKEAQSV